MTEQEMNQRCTVLMERAGELMRIMLYRRPLTDAERAEQARIEGEFSTLTARLEALHYGSAI